MASTGTDPPLFSPPRCGPAREALRFNGAYTHFNLFHNIALSVCTQSEDEDGRHRHNPPTIGALFIAYSEFEMNRTISMWLQTLDMTVDQIVQNDVDIVRVRGLEKHWDRDLRRDKWMSPLGWILFLVGYFILIGRLHLAH
jgi:hypothetical protein